MVRGLQLHISHTFISIDENLDTDSTDNPAATLETDQQEAIPSTPLTSSEASTSIIAFDNSPSVPLALASSSTDPALPNKRRRIPKKLD